MSKFASLCIFLLLALLLAHTWHGPDIWYHLTWGREILDRGTFVPNQRTLIQQPIHANNYWLFQVLMQTLYAKFGAIAVTGLFGVLWLTITWIWMLTSQAQPLVLLAWVVCVQLRFEQRPEVFSYLFLMSQIAFLTTRTKLTAKDLVLLFVGQALWTNMHGYFALGPMVVAAHALNHRYKTNLVAVGTTFLATLVSPFGIESWYAVAAYAGVSRGLRDLNSELFSPALSWAPPLPVFWLMWIVVLFLVARALYLRRLSFALCLAIGGLILGVQASRNLPLFLIMSAPLLRDLNGLWRQPRFLQVVSAGVALALAVLVVRGDYHRQTRSLSSFGLHLEGASYPQAAVRMLTDLKFGGRLFTDSYDGGFVQYHIPQVQVAGDSYFSDPEMTRQLFAATRDPNALMRLHDQHRFDALLVNVENLEVIDHLVNSKDWVLVHSDLHRALFASAHLGLPPVPLAAGPHYQGEDLRNWVYAFGLRTWTAIAWRYKDAELMLNLIREVERAEHIPDFFLNQARKFAEQTDNATALTQLSALTSRRIEDP